MTTMDPALWWEPPGQNAGNSPPALLFPFAGADVSAVRAWVTELGSARRAFVMRYPGRGVRFREPFAASVDELADAAASSAASIGRAPLLLGHSLGAWVAHRTAVLLTDRGITPELLVVAAAAPPHLTVSNGTPWHLLPAEQLVAVLTELGGQSTELLAREDFREAFLPVIRADLRLSYEHGLLGSHQAARCPVAAIGGAGDITTIGLLTGWLDLAAGPFQARVLPGGHFFHQHGHIGLADLLTAAAWPRVRPGDAGGTERRCYRVLSSRGSRYSIVPKSSPALPGWRDVGFSADARTCERWVTEHGQTGPTAQRHALL